MAASPATHPRFSIYRTEAHYTFALAPARYEDQVPLALEGVVGLLRDFGCAYDFHKHYAEESWAKEWDIWTERPMPASLLQRIRAVEGVLYIFRSHPAARMIPLEPSTSEETPDSDSEHTNSSIEDFDDHEYYGNEYDGDSSDEGDVEYEDSDDADDN